MNHVATARWAKRLSFNRMMISLFLLSSGYAIFIATASELEWPISAWILSNDDLLVGALSYVIPLLSRYRQWMVANNFPAHVDLMENVYSVGWLFFAVFCLISLPMLNTWADEFAERRKFSGTTLQTAATASKFFFVLLAASIWLGFFGSLDFAEYPGRAILAERIHVNKWYAARASLLISWSYWALFLSLIIGTATKRTKLIT